MTEALIADLAGAIDRQDAASLAQMTQRLIEACRQLAAENRWDELRPLADAADAQLAEAREAGTLQTESMALVADLSQQAMMVLALAGDCGGARDNGYFRAALLHAKRVDSVTENRLGLVSLVEQARE